jgi:hypothetical protein
MEAGLGAVEGTMGRCWRIVAAIFCAGVVWGVLWGMVCAAAAAARLKIRVAVINLIGWLDRFFGVAFWSPSSIPLRGVDGFRRSAISFRRSAFGRGHPLVYTTDSLMGDGLRLRIYRLIYTFGSKPDELHAP